jgi:integrase
MELIGHSTLDMTMTGYGHVPLKDKRTALDQIGDLFEDDEDSGP